MLRKVALMIGLLPWPTGAASQAPALQPARRPIPYPVVPSAAFQRAVERGSRTATGEPGPNYWQQWTDYTLSARLDPELKRLQGTARIIYHNRSPDTLNAVFLELAQNLHAPGAVRNEPQEVTGGVELTKVVAFGRRLSERPPFGPGYVVNGTSLQIRLPRALSPRDSVGLEIEWAFTIPQNGAGRMGWSENDLFFLAYWYPQVAVYDDVAGWQTDPYQGRGEFYAGFGRYDVTVDAPEGWVVLGTGRLENAEQVLTDPVRERLARAERSDTVVAVLTANDLADGRATRRGERGRLKWRLVADTARDMAFSATRRSLWDAGRAAVGDRNGDGQADYTRVDALYRPEHESWRQAARFGQHSVTFLSQYTAMPYPWTHMSVVEGSDIVSGGMEYPMMTLIDVGGSSDSTLYEVTVHEIAHMWVPMIVSTDERRYAWLDEGHTEFHQIEGQKDHYPGLDAEAGDRTVYLNVARAGSEDALMRWTDLQYPAPAWVIAAYQKPATVLAALRGVVGPRTFLDAHRRFLSDWAYRHPTPWDFFNTVNRVAGRNLDWFWRSWYYETWTLDHAVGAVKTGGTGGTGGTGLPVERVTTVVVEDRGLVPMPARLTITLESGEVLHREVPVENWLAGARTAEVILPAGARVRRVEIDAEHAFPDVNRANNIWDVP